MIREYLTRKLAGERLQPLNLTEARSEAKAVTYGRSSTFIPSHSTGGLPNTQVDYKSAVGDGLGSSVLMSPIKWIQRTFPEAYLEVLRLKDNALDPIPNHPMVQLVDNPNPHYTGIDLWKPTLYSYIFDGNGYWRIIRNENTLAPVELWYVPHWMMTPKWLPGEFISWYDFSPGNGPPVRIHPDDVIHFRNGVDPRNTRLGMSDVMSELREIYGDAEAANYTASLLRNMGVPGIVFSPKGEGTVIDNIDQVKQQLMEKFTGDRRGEPLVNGIAIDVKEFGFDPKKMDMGSLRDIDEERVCAAIGVPAAVVGFGSGLQQTKVGATMEALIGLAWNQRIIPDQKSFAETLTVRLLPEFEPRPTGMEVRFNTSDVQALQTDRNEEAKRATELFAGGLIKRSEGREMIGLGFEDADQVYRLPMNILEIGADGTVGLETEVRDALMLIASKTDPKPTQIYVAPPQVTTTVEPSKTSDVVVTVPEVRADGEVVVFPAEIAAQTLSAALGEVLKTKIEEGMKP